MGYEADAITIRPQQPTFFRSFFIIFLLPATVDLYLNGINTHIHIDSCGNLGSERTRFRSPPLKNKQTAFPFLYIEKKNIYHRDNVKMSPYCSIS